MSVLLEVKQGHYHALFSAGMDPSYVSDMESLLQQVRRSAEEERRVLDADESSLNRIDDSILEVSNPKAHIVSHIVSHNASHKVKEKIHL